MLNYSLKRLFFAIPTLLGVIFISFCLLRSIPGNPAHVLVGERASQEVIEAYEEKLGLNLPFPIQFGKYLLTICEGDFGVSYFSGKPVLGTLLQKFPNTFKLAFFALLFSFILGTITGLLAAAFKGSWLDKFLLFFSLLGLSIPVFWVGLLLILVFAIYLPLLPPGGMGNGHWTYLILPVITLGARTAAATFRLSRTCFLKILKEKYIQTAFAKGLPKNKILCVHVFKNALIPIVTFLGLDFGSTLGGAVLTETVFGWDGIGRFAVEGLFKRDYPVILGTILFGAIVFVIVNLVIDLLYAKIDPRIEYK